MTNLLANWALIVIQKTEWRNMYLVIRKLHHALTWNVMSVLRENYCVSMHLLQMVKIKTWHVYGGRTMTLPTVSIRQVSHNLNVCIRVLYHVHHEVCTTPSHQAEFRRMKDGLNGADDVLLHFDLSENFFCRHQESIQSAYWCQSQVSIFTVAVYRKDADPEMDALIWQITQRPPLSSIWSIYWISMQSMAATSFCGVTAQAANLRIDSSPGLWKCRRRNLLPTSDGISLQHPTAKVLWTEWWSAEAESLEQSQGKTDGYPKCDGVYGRSERWRNHLQFSHWVSKRDDTCSWLGILCQYDASIWVWLPVASWSKRWNLLLLKWHCENPCCTSTF